MIEQMIEASVGVLALMGCLTALLTARTFKLRHWKHPVQVVAISLALFAGYQFLIAGGALNEGIFQAVMELFIIAPLLYAVGEIKKTARLIGA